MKNLSQTNFNHSLCKTYICFSSHLCINEELTFMKSELPHLFTAIQAYEKVDLYAVFFQFCAGPIQP